MDRARWLYLKALRPSLGKLLHLSCDAGMIRNPTGNLVPWIQRPGTSYNIGRNKAKHVRRASRLIQRHG